MKLRFLITTICFLFLINLAYTAQFNYGSELAAKSPNAHKTLINALEKSGDRIFGVGVHGIIVYSDDEGESWTQADEVPFTKTLTGIKGQYLYLDQKYVFNVRRHTGYVINLQIA